MREYGDTVVQVGSECGNLEKCTIKTSKMAHSNSTVFRMGEKRRILSVTGFPLDGQEVFCYTKKEVCQGLLKELAARRCGEDGQAGRSRNGNQCAVGSETR